MWWIKDCLAARALHIASRLRVKASRSSEANCRSDFAASSSFTTPSTLLSAATWIDFPISITSSLIKCPPAFPYARTRETRVAWCSSTCRSSWVSMLKEALSSSSAVQVRSAKSLAACAASHQAANWSTSASNRAFSTVFWCTSFARCLNCFLSTQIFDLRTSASWYKGAYCLQGYGIRQSEYVGDEWEAGAYCSWTRLPAELSPSNHF